MCIFESTLKCQIVLVGITRVLFVPHSRSCIIASRPEVMLLRFCSFASDPETTVTAMTTLVNTDSHLKRFLVEI